MSLNRAIINAPLLLLLVLIVSVCLLLLDICSAKEEGQRPRPRVRFQSHSTTTIDGKVVHEDSFDTNDFDGDHGSDDHRSGDDDHRSDDDDDDEHDDDDDDDDPPVTSYTKHQQTTITGGGGGFPRTKTTITTKSRQRLPPPLHPPPAGRLRSHPNPVVPSPPAEPVYEGWDRATLLHEATAIHLSECKSSALVTMLEHQKHALVVQSKKMRAVDMGAFEFVLDVDSICDHWAFDRSQPDCFRLKNNMDPEFYKALKSYHIDAHDYSFGNHYLRAMFCKLIRRMDAKQGDLRESRIVREPEHLNKLVDIIVVEQKKERKMPAPYKQNKQFPIKFGNTAYHVAKAFWIMVEITNQFHTLYTKHADLEGNACLVLYSDSRKFKLMRFFKSMTGIKQPWTTGLPSRIFSEIIEKRYKALMKHIPLEVSGDPKQENLLEENCAFNLFLFRVIFELFLATTNAVAKWLQNNPYRSYIFCPKWRRHCTYVYVAKKVKGFRYMTTESIKMLGSWFTGPSQGRIEEDFREFEDNYVRDRFHVYVPPPPPLPPNPNAMSKQVVKFKNGQMKVKQKTGYGGGGGYNMAYGMDPMAMMGMMGGGYSQMQHMSHQMHGPYGGPSQHTVKQVVDDGYQRTVTTSRTRVEHHPGDGGDEDFDDDDGYDDGMKKKR